MTVRLDDVAARATAQSLGKALAELEDLPESRPRTLAFEVLDALLQLHGEGWARVLVAHRDGAMRDAFFTSDEVVSQLLTIHGLLPHAPPAPATPPLVQLERRRQGPGGEPYDEFSEVADATDEASQCELCAAPIAAEHRHLVDLDARQLLCACGACAILFDRTDVGGRYRLVPRRYRALDPALLDGGLWEQLALPVDIAFLFVSSKAERPIAFYPGPMGTTESSLPLPAWSEIAAKSPVLATLAPDVEAILVRRTRGARDYWIVPVDQCYALAGIMRRTWEGISGGERMRRAVDAFFRRIAKHDERPHVHMRDEPLEVTCKTT
jgi:hypothetical protein